jgi:hypothetical protein
MGKFKKQRHFLLNIHHIWRANILLAGQKGAFYGTLLNKTK